MDYGQPETLDIEARADGVLAVRLNRPDKHNAFNAVVIEELRRTFEVAGQDDGVRAVLLTGNGRSFSAGADIAWMRAQGEADHASNLEGARRMAAMFHAIWACPKPVVAGIHGAALGGGTGLAAVADIGIAAESAVFGFTEVRLGIVPAVISPFVVEKLGTAAARPLFLLGRRFDGREAERVGLVYRCCPDDQLQEQVDSCLQDVLAGGPSALREAKALTQGLIGSQLLDQAERCAELIARLRGSDEAQEGLSAFLEKRTASWRP